MTDLKLIFLYLNIIIPDDHPAIFQYIMGKTRSKESAIDRIMKLTEEVFYPILDKPFIKNAIKEFLEIKRKQHGRGEIVIKSIY